MALATAPYSSIFPISGAGSPRPGYWLVAKNGRGTVVTEHNLPREGQGFKYYWLGSDPNHAELKLLDAIAKLKVKLPASPDIALPDVRKAAHGPVALPTPKKGLAGLLQGVDLIPIPGGSSAVAATDAEAAGAGAAGAEAGAATGAESGAAAGGAAGAASKLASGEALGALVAFLLDPKSWLRLVEVVGGVMLLAMGLRALTGGAVDPIGAGRKVARAAA